MSTADKWLDELVRIWELSEADRMDALSDLADYIADVEQELPQWWRQKNRTWLERQDWAAEERVWELWTSDEVENVQRVTLIPADHPQHSWLTLGMARYCSGFKGTHDQAKRWRDQQMGW